MQIILFSTFFFFFGTFFFTYLVSLQQTPLCERGFAGDKDTAWKVEGHDKDAKTSQESV